MRSLKHAFPPAALVLALVACGDDDVTGTGGAGGEAATSTGSTSSTTTATTTASTTVSSTGGSGGGGDGGSGHGGAGPGGGGGSGGGTGGASVFECSPEPSEGAAITIVTVDEAGDEVPVLRVLWEDEPADPFWLEADEATCAGGLEPPCSVWEIEEAPAGRIAISSERETEAEATEACFPYASTFVEVHPASSRQLVHLTLPTYGTYCIDPESGRSVVNVEHDEQVDETDCLAPPPDVAGAITVDVVDQEGEPVPASIASWYYDPESDAYDGEHPLACADQRCTAWVVTDDPAPGTIYVSASYAGPLNPFVQTGWVGYEGMPVEIEADEGGGIVPITVTLALSTVDEGAIGGDR